MTHTLERSALRAFFEPYAALGHKSTARLFIHRTITRQLGNRDAEWHTHGAGYVCDVRDDAVAKYVSGMNATDWLPFDTINRIEVRDWITGDLLLEYQVTGGPIHAHA